MAAVQQLAAYEERRKYPRLKINLPARVSRHQGKQVDAMIYDLSPDGIQVRCTKQTAGLVHPVDSNIDMGNKPVVVVAFSIPHHKGEKEIIARCKICHMILLDQNSAVEEVAFGMKFTRFKDNCEKYISQYFIQEMEPAE